MVRDKEGKNAQKSNQKKKQIHIHGKEKKSVPVKWTQLRNKNYA